MTIAIGDTMPAGDFGVMGDDGPDKVTTDALFSGKTVVLFSVPGAFTPTCNAQHLPGYIENAAALETLDRMKQEGLIRAYGMSTKTVEGGCWIVENADVVMATLNLDTADELPVIERAQQMNKGVVIKKGLQSGHADSVEDAFRYVLTRPGVSSMIVGTINPGHLRSNVELCNRVTEGRA